MADMLASLTDLATYLQKSTDPASPDALDTTIGTLALEVATAVVQEAAGGQRIVRVVGGTDEIVVTGWSSYLRLPQQPVVSVASVVLDGITLSVGTASGAYRLAGGRLFRSEGWLGATGEPSVATAVYTSGLLSTDQRIQMARGAALSIAAIVYDNPTGVSREQIDDYSIAYERAQAAMDASPALRRALRRQYGRRAGLVTI